MKKYLLLLLCSLFVSVGMQAKKYPEIKFEKTRFLKTMPIIKQRREFNQLNLSLQSGDALLKLGGDAN